MQEITPVHPDAITTVIVTVLFVGTWLGIVVYVIRKLKSK